MDPAADETKKLEIIDQLVWNDSVNASNIHVTVEGNLAILEGSVPSYTEKLTAEREAFLVPGITHVDNLLEVEFPPEVGLPGDDEIAANVKSKLLWNDQLNADGILVDCIDGVVALTGTVDSFWEKNLAEDIAISSTGVIRVDNRLKVIPKMSAIDIEVEEDIRKAFQRSALVDDNAVRVSVNNGMAHLSGNVPFYAMKREALNIAAFTTGVVDVVDEISVG
ncbi:MAG: BON domain-containing protein [Bacteroidales bacterium]